MNEACVWRSEIFHLPAWGILHGHLGCELERHHLINKLDGRDAAGHRRREGTSAGISSLIATLEYVVNGWGRGSTHR